MECTKWAYFEKNSWGSMPPIQFTQQPLAMHNMPQADVVIIGLFNWLEQLNTNNAVSVICLQETWLSSESSTSLYDLPN